MPCHRRRPRRRLRKQPSRPSKPGTACRAPTARNRERAVYANQRRGQGRRRHRRRGRDRVVAGAAAGPGGGEGRRRRHRRRRRAGAGVEGTGGSALRQDRRHLRGGDRADGGRDAEGVRPDRCAGQQRRALYGIAVGRTDAGGVAHADGGQRRRHLPRHESGGAGDDGAGRWQDHQHRVGHGLDGHARLRPLRRQQGRGDGLHPRHRQRARPARDHQRLRHADAARHARHPRRPSRRGTSTTCSATPRSAASRSRRTSTA